jgi:hypothetical protein
LIAFYQTMANDVIAYWNSHPDRSLTLRLLVFNGTAMPAPAETPRRHDWKLRSPVYSWSSSAARSRLLLASPSRSSQKLVHRQMTGSDAGKSAASHRSKTLLPSYNRTCPQHSDIVESRTRSTPWPCRGVFADNSFLKRTVPNDLFAGKNERERK